MPDPEKSLMVPPVTFTSSDVNSVDGSDRVIVNSAVSPTFNEVEEDVILRVGSNVSTSISTELDDVFPAASVALIVKV